jgi:glutaredoxin
MERKIAVYGVDTCEDTVRTRERLAELELDYEYLNLDRDPAADQKVKDANGGKRKTPMVVLRAGAEERVLWEPENPELDRELERMQFVRRHGSGKLSAA